VVRIAVLALALAACSWHIWSTRPIARPPGILAPGKPEQEKVDEGPRWQIAGHEVRGLARFAIAARVLSAERYRFDRAAELSPIDLALGWGPMSANEVIETLDIRQGSRLYLWSSPAPRIGPGAIALHSANMHMIPATAEIRRELLRARPGNLVRVIGWLVEVRGPDGWIWRSSLTRRDSGDGACEVVLVQQVDLG
jgi:hypothetical protein